MLGRSRAPETKLAGIAYLITNQVNGKNYIGITRDLAKRWYEHRRRSRNPKCPLQWAIARYGSDKFSIGPIASARSWSELQELEKTLILQYGTYGKRGYNATPGGEGPTLVTLRKMREAQTGKRLTDEHKKRLSIARTGRKLSAEHLEKIVRSNKGRKRSVAFCEKASARLKGIKPSPQTMVAACEANRNRKITEEMRANYSAAQKGRRHSLKAIAKMSASKKGKSVSQQHREKISASLTGKRPSETALIKLRARRHTLQTRMKMSVTRRGQKQSPEHIAARLASRQRRLAQNNLVGI